MQLTQTYSAEPSQRDDDNALPGLTVLEFSTPWRGLCQIVQPMLHLKTDDGKGRGLGRSLGGKLWPTVILLRDGHEIARLTRPNNVRVIAQMLAHAR